MIDRPIDELRRTLLDSIKKDGELSRDTDWFPPSLKVDMVACLLAQQELVRASLFQIGADCADIEVANVEVARLIRWLRRRGAAHPEEVPDRDTLRRRWSSAAEVLLEQEEQGVDDLDDAAGEIAEVATLAQGSCHLISREFYGGWDALFEE